MTSGTRRSHRSPRLHPGGTGRRLRAGMAIGLGAWAALAWGQPRLELDELMHSLREVTEVRADYHESIVASLLEQRLSSSGRLQYRAPDQIVKTADTGEEVRIEGDAVTITSGTKTSRFSLSEHPAVETLVLALRATFAGDLSQLRLAYEVAFRHQDQSAWILELTPKDRRLLPFFERIEIHGTARRIGRLNILESNGDRRDLQLTTQRIIVGNPPD